MNIAPSTQSLGGPAGAQAKPGKGGDPLADFMALLSQLGIAVEGDDATTPATTENQDVAAQLLAKLAKKIEGAAGDAVPATGVSEEDAKKEGSIATLDDLLVNLHPGTAPADPAKLDIAALIAAVRAFAADSSPAKAQQGDVAATEGEAVQSAPAMTSSIAALLARVTQAAGKTIAPQTEELSSGSPESGNVKSTFARLESLVAQPATSKAEKADSSGAGDTAANRSAAQLGEMIARLTDTTRSGAGPVAQAATPIVATAQAAIAQAIRQGAHDDQPAQTATDPAALTAPVLGIASSAPSLASNGITTAQGQAAQTPAEEMVAHHLDLAKDSQWLDSLARDITRAAQSDAKLRFDLNPEHLGSLKVELLNGTNGTSVKMTTETEAARAILADAQPRLVAEARAQGLRISEAHVNLGGQGGGHRPTPETPVVIRTAAGGGSLGEVELERPAASGERYA